MGQSIATINVEVRDKDSGKLIAQVSGGLAVMQVGSGPSGVAACWLLAWPKSIGRERRQHRSTANTSAAGDARQVPSGGGATGQQQWAPCKHSVGRGYGTAVKVVRSGVRLKWHVHQRLRSVGWLL